ncbi:GL15527 [Drosophila persimilis]|uniref:GL15527 n=1 Tax=Drosophila persimilis TaxID=7234 RepID=B4H6E8_DROPE|nr:GL15527 [Drosophila persimilis]
MKFAGASVVLLIAILGAQAVDWKSVKNLNIETDALASSTSSLTKWDASPTLREELPEYIQPDNLPVKSSDFSYRNYSGESAFASSWLPVLLPTATP